MSPASKEEFAKIAECATKIQHLEETIKELKSEIEKLRTDKKETQQRISDRRLAIYLTLASVLGATILKLIEWLPNLKV